MKIYTFIILNMLICNDLATRQLVAVVLTFETVFPAFPIPPGYDEIFSYYYKYQSRSYQMS